MILANGGVGGLEVREDSEGGFLVCTRGDGAADEHLHPVAHEHPHLVAAAAGQGMILQRGVGGAVQILQGIQQGAVQVENGGLVRHGRSP